MWAVGLSVWTVWLLRHAHRHAHDTPASPEAVLEAASGRDVLNLALLLLPLGCYVVGALRWDWGFNELSGAFLVGAIAVGLLSGLRADGTTVTLLEGAQAMLP